MISFLIALFFSSPRAADTPIPPVAPAHAATVSPVAEPLTVPEISATLAVPFYSQFSDIDSPNWRKVACGVTSLAMVVNFFEPGATTPSALLARGIDSGAYLEDAGWTHAGLISLGARYGLGGESYDLSGAGALDALEEYLKDGPVIASVHYKLDPANVIPHLVVVTEIEDDVVHYNDPANKSGDAQISTAAFLAGWKKRVIVIRPEAEAGKA